MILSRWVVQVVTCRLLIASILTLELYWSDVRRLATSARCVVGGGLGLWLRNRTSIDDSSTMSTYDFEPLGGVGGGMQAPDCFYIHSRVVLE